MVNPKNLLQGKVEIRGNPDLTPTYIHHKFTLAMIPNLSFQLERNPRPLLLSPFLLTLSFSFVKSHSTMFFFFHLQLNLKRRGIWKRQTFLSSFWLDFSSNNKLLIDIYQNRFDGTQVLAMVKKSKHVQYHNRKGFISQNVRNVVFFHL